ncbi:MAG: CRISPR-associated endoribonuclease Cas6 [Bacteroidota bacterium]
MRIRIIFSLKNRGATLPFFHQHLFGEIIEHILYQGSSQSSVLNYHFSGLKGQTRISRKGLHYCSKLVTLVFACASQRTIDKLLDTLFSRDLWEVGGLRLEPIRAEVEQLPDFDTEMKFICMSPIIPTARFQEPSVLKSFIEPDKNEFSDFLYETTMSRLEKSGRYTADQMSEFYQFQVVPDKRYLAKLRSQEKKFARIYQVSVNGRPYELRGYTFPMTLYAVKEVQEFVFTSGLGSFTEQGFGMLDLAHRDSAEQTAIYKNYQRTTGSATAEADRSVMPSSS